MDPERVRELFARFGPVDVRRMFGGAGIFADGVMFALISDETDLSEGRRADGLGLRARKARRVSVRDRRGHRSLTSYRRMPERLYDDPEELAEWARAAHPVALRPSLRKRKPARPPRRK